MGRFTAYLIKSVREWDYTARGLLAIGLALIPFALSIIIFAPLEWRLPGLVALTVAIILVQVAFMWGNRQAMQSPFMKAQRAYINGDFDTARQYLETLREQDNADIQALTLLGNTYRQLGLLNRSREVLSEALNIDPDHYFPLYGFGRTLLAEGHYAEAAQTIQSALDAGAPPAVAFDFGEAQYRAGQLDEAVQVLQAARPELRESYRILMTDYLLYRLDAGLPPAADLINAGLPYWQASAQRFQQTPYGAALAADVHALLSLLED